MYVLLFNRLYFNNKTTTTTTTYMLMTLATSLDVLLNCYATADILTKLLQQCFLFFIVVVIKVIEKQ